MDPTIRELAIQQHTRDRDAALRRLKRALETAIREIDRGDPTDSDFANCAASLMRESLIVTRAESALAAIELSGTG